MASYESTGIEETSESVKHTLGRLQLKQVVRNELNGTSVTAGQQIWQIKRRLDKVVGDYTNLKNVKVLPRMNSGKIKVTNAKDSGKGYIHELMIRMLFDEDQLYEAGSGYFVVHNYQFRSQQLKGDKTGYHKVLGKHPKNRAEVSGFSREQDFILLHPTRGLIFAEVKAFSDCHNVNGFKRPFEECKKQCSDGLKCMRAYVKDLIKLDDPEGFNETEVEKKLDPLFKMFKSLLIFPSLSNKILKNQEAKALVNSLDENVKIFFKEDREAPIEMRRNIEENGFVNIPDEFSTIYRLVYEIALSCCVFLVKGIIRMDFTPRERSDTRNEHLASMEKIYLDYEQELIRECQEKILFVEGVAGSGKTLICLAKMFDIAQNHPEGSILYLCRNRRLADRVRSLVEERKEQETDASRKQCYNHIKVYNISTWFKHHKLKSWTDSPQKNKLREEYKHVFIDEYQDLTWRKFRVWFQDIFMSRLQGDSSTAGTFWVFYDNDQKIIPPDDTVSTVVVPHNVSYRYLRTVYRSPYYVTQCLTSYAKKHKSIEIGHEFLGMQVKIYHGDTEEEMYTILSETITKLKKEHSLSRDEITVVYFSYNIDVEKLNSLECNSIVGHDMKGLESKVVIYLDNLECPSHDFHYVVCSRALWMYIAIVSSLRAKLYLESKMDPSAFPNISPERCDQMIRV